jgi:AcrR family transcriptional regulator
MPRDKQHTRKQIIDAAYVLFRKRGYTRVNVDEIADAAGITKRTLYSHFASKDALLENVLEEQHERAFAAFQTFGCQLVGKPEAIVRLFFADLLRWSATSKWAGSGFTRLAMELADLPGHPARRIASAHKRLLEAHLTEAFAAAGVANAAGCARKIWILSEGAMALMLIHGDRGYCKAAEEAALSVIAGER